VCDTWFLISTDRWLKTREISRVIVCTFWKYGQRVHIIHAQIQDSRFYSEVETISGEQWPIKETGNSTAEIRRRADEG
jgi:hypothetical protein